ncbi:MAG: 5-(carboxyamino)imidazole ribonucleotide mutase [Halobacteriales archaeon]|nr:5-(carboxyamino)imidazole ribonucleotide mutase [Halobacteriales archaeon]
MTDTPTLEALLERLRAEAAADHDPEATPDVGIVMGSDSDLPVMRGAHDALVDLGFEEDTGDGTDARYSFESHVVSAHRTPDLMDVYARTAEDRGLEVIIAGAGGKSADLPNMTASIAFPLPVIGVPVQEKSVDSVIGMPTGAPILAVDAGKSYNAALSAVQLLARQHPALRDRLVDRHARLREDVAKAAERLHRTGTPAYLDEE